MSPVHFELMSAAFRGAGFNLVIPPLPDRAAIEEGLKYVNNDACYPTIIVIGQLIHALKSGEYDLNNTSILLAQTGGGCRATNYVAIARKALRDAGMGQVPVLSLRKDNNSNFTLSWSLFKNLVISIIYGDLLMRVLYRVRPYEKQPGAAQALYNRWLAKCKEKLASGNSHNFKRNIFGIVRDFEQLEIDEQCIKPRVGLVGEILVKYHPTANNHLVEMLEREGAEVVVPDLLDFFLYCFYDSTVRYQLLAGTFLDKLKGDITRRVIELYRRHLRKALAASKRFQPPLTIEQIAQLAAKHLSLGNFTGEGWLLTGEMIELIHSGVQNIVCMQPFACLPNHIVGKGMIREIRRHYPEVNIVAIDYDPGASEVNQQNRIKLMLSNAKKKLQQSITPQPRLYPKPS